MQYFVRSVLCSLVICFSTLVAQADQPATPPAASPVQPSLLKTDPGLSLSPIARETAPPVVTTRIGVVDINKVSTDSAMGKAAQSQVKSQQAKLLKQADAKRKQLDKFKADTERQLPSLSPQQREAKSKEFQKKVEEFQKFGMNAEKELTASQQKLTKGLFEAIGKVAEELGKTRGLTAIVINRELLFLGDKVEPVDLTDDLIKLIDQKWPAKK